MQSSTIHSALSEVRHRLKESRCPCYAKYGTPVTWAPIFHTPLEISAQVCLPVAAALHPVWIPNSQHWTPNCGPQSTPLHQTTVQPTSASWIQTGANPHVMQGTPRPQQLSPMWANNPPINRDFGGPQVLYTPNQIPFNEFRPQHNDSFKAGSRVAAFSLGQEIDNLLSRDWLRWDIRQHPSAARSAISPSTVPNLDIQALPLGVEWSEINFGNNRMKLFADTWGPIHVQTRSDLHTVTHGISNPISIRDILDEIYRYFMLPLDEEERTRLMSTQRQNDEISAAFQARRELQGWDYDFYRRADLLPRLSNFGKIELVGRGINSSFLQLRLY